MNATNLIWIIFSVFAISVTVFGSIFMVFFYEDGTEKACKSFGWEKAMSILPDGRCEELKDGKIMMHRIVERNGKWYEVEK